MTQNEKRKNSMNKKSATRKMKKTSDKITKDQRERQLQKPK